MNNKEKKLFEKKIHDKSEYNLSIKFHRKLKKTMTIISSGVKLAQLVTMRGGTERISWLYKNPNCLASSLTKADRRSRDSAFLGQGWRKIGSKDSR
ncbi:hypothetical protein EYC84_003349 [Monilinia fructicola]|uniref:Uncharacterized protein n=1 Tax=Monilinia fructicola TaxID=38448 RepID=A0A5M9JTC1_MONFR|nr:hypothetical protein EYC84_003349 [Monilinia fructicola]